MAIRTGTTVNLSLNNTMYYWYKCPKCDSLWLCTTEFKTTKSYSSRETRDDRAMNDAKRIPAQAKLEEAHKQRLADVNAKVQAREFDYINIYDQCPKCKNRLPWQSYRHADYMGLRMFSGLISGFLIFYGIILLCVEEEPKYATAIILFIIAALIIFAMIKWIRPISKKERKQLNDECKALDDAYIPHFYWSQEAMEQDLMRRGIPFDRRENKASNYRT